MSTFTGSGAAKALPAEQAAKTAANAPKIKRFGFTFIDRSSLELQVRLSPVRLDTAGARSVGAGIIRTTRNRGNGDTPFQGKLFQPSAV
jgi:hypothetical protein